MRQFKKYFGITMLVVLVSVGVYFLYIHNFLAYSLGLHPDNINNLNLGSMLARGINPNVFEHATPDEKELFNFTPFLFIFYSIFLRLIESPVQMLAVVNFGVILISFATIYFVTKQWFGVRVALLTLLSAITSVWFVLVFRLNFTAYIAICSFVMIIFYLYWDALEKQSYQSFALCVLCSVLGVLLTTWTVLLPVLYLIFYSLRNPMARAFIFRKKNLQISVVTLAGTLLIAVLLANLFGVKGNLLGNYLQYFYGKRLPEHGGAVHGSSGFLFRLQVFNLMLNNYYEAICTLWQHQRVVAPPVQIIQPFWLIVALLGVVTSFLSEKSKEVFLASYVVLISALLIFVFIPNERYFVIVLPFVYILASLFLWRVIERFSVTTFNREFSWVLLCIGVLLTGSISIKNNYLLYNKIINDYVVGGADRRRHGVDKVRQVIQKAHKSGRQVYVSYNINADRIDLDNYYGLNFEPTLKYLSVSDFLNAAIQFSKSANPGPVYVFDLSRFLVGSDQLEKILLEIGFKQAERIYDLNGNYYKTIYVLGNGT